MTKILFKWIKWKQFKHSKPPSSPNFPYNLAAEIEWLLKLSFINNCLISS